MPTKPPPKRTLLAIPAPAKLSLLSLSFDNIDVLEATSKISNSLELVVNELSAITILLLAAADIQELFGPFNRATVKVLVVTSYISIVLKLEPLRFPPAK